MMLALVVLIALASQQGIISCDGLSSPSAPSSPGSSSISQIISQKSNGKHKYFSQEGDEGSDDKRRKWGGGSGLSRANVRRMLQSTFLPSSSSSSLRTLQQSGYLKYCLYDNVQDLSTQLRSVLATQRILEGVGVGRADATALGATLNFLVRDGCGMLSSLLFTSLVASKFRSDWKRWKLFADVILDVGITLEMLAASAPRSCFLPLLCLGNVGKALCGVAAGACSGSVNLYWAQLLTSSHDNISEVAAKFGAQRTVTGALGLLLAAFLAKRRMGQQLDGTAVHVLSYLCWTAIHLLANWKSLRLISLDWLNHWRLDFVLTEFINHQTRTNHEAQPIMSNPSKLAKVEPLLFLPTPLLKKRNKYPIFMGISFNQFVHSSVQPISYSFMSKLQSQTQTQQRQRQRQQTQIQEKYIITVGNHPTRTNAMCILVVFFSNVTKKQQARAYLHARILQQLLLKETFPSRQRQQQQQQQSKLHDNDEIMLQLIKDVEQMAQNKITHWWPLFEQSATNVGWKLDKTECPTEGYEIHLS